MSYGSYSPRKSDFVNEFFSGILKYTISHLRPHSGRDREELNLESSPLMLSAGVVC